ncbi:MAG: NifU family protein [Armatimonadota bacterium]|nr:NifU family protein [Armatimonadota bacterium]
MSEEKQKLIEKVEEALKKVRPSLEADGGGVELVDVTDDNVAEVRLQGACRGCPMAQMTLAMGIGRVLRQEVPEITDVRAVE